MKNEKYNEQESKESFVVGDAKSSSSIVKCWGADRIVMSAADSTKKLLLLARNNGPSKISRYERIRDKTYSLSC